MQKSLLFLVALTISSLLFYSAISLQSNTAAKLLRKPYLQCALADSISILWRTDIGQKCHIKYKKSNGKSWKTIQGRVRPTNTSCIENEVTIKGLKANTKYDYQIFTDDIQLSKDHNYHFTAAKSRRQKPFSFFAVGDVGEPVAEGGTPDQLAKSLENFQGDFDFGLLLGDIIYPQGQSKNYDKNLFQYFGNIFPYIPVYPILGNHDWHEPEQNYVLEWKLPHNEHYYSFDYANIHFIALDSKKGDFYNYEAQKAWLENDLTSVGKKLDWIIILVHHNGKSCTYKDDNEKVMSLYPLFEKHNVDLVLNGHAHTYERLQPMNSKGELAKIYPYGQSNYENPKGFISITVGSGGKLRGVGTDPKAFEPNPENCRHPNLVAQSIHSWVFLDLSIDGKTLKAKAIRTLDNKVVDEFEVLKD